MKEGIHPEYHSVKVRCACGAEVDTGSTVQNLSVEICSSCHPFFTGKQKLIDTAGRVEKFNTKFKSVANAKEARAAAQAKAAKTTAKRGG